MNKVPRFVMEFLHYAEKENKEKCKEGTYFQDEVEIWKEKAEKAICSYRLGFSALHEVMEIINEKPVTI